MNISKEQFQKAYEALIIAEGFLGTANLIDQSIRDGFQRTLTYIYPYTVNAAAACELALKSLLILQDGECPEKHPLDGLYAKIDDGLKNIISKRYRDTKCSMSLGKCLQTYQNSVVEWRYAFDDRYQSKNLTAAWKELLVLDNILCDIGNEQLQASPFYKEEVPHAD